MKNMICITFKDNKKEFIYGNDIALVNNEIVISSAHGIHRYNLSIVKCVYGIYEMGVLKYEKNISKNKRKQKNNK